MAIRSWLRNLFASRKRRTIRKAPARCRGLPMAVLQVLKGGAPGPLPLDRDTITFGRDTDCNVVLRGRTVSRMHARLVLVNGQYFLEDRQSRHGTFVNDEVIESGVLFQLLRNNDRIQIGDFVATFHDALPAEVPVPPGVGPEEACPFSSP